MDFQERHGDNDDNDDDDDNDDNKWFSNTQVRHVLSKALLGLSFKDRKDVEEEIHGVSSMERDETPELVRESLAEMMHELEYVIPPNLKMGYMHAKIHYPSSYVHQPFFRLRFLRSTLFDGRHAAMRVVRFLDLVREHFGDQCLQRPPELEDFSKAEQRMLKRGTIQFMPYRDRAGRKILVVVPGDIPGITQHFRRKALLYLCWLSGSNGLGEDLETQRKGLVVLAWFTSTKLLHPKQLFARGLKDTFPHRVVGCHVCMPNAEQFIMGRFLFAAAVRGRIRIHTGSAMEILYTLCAFGIPVQTLPITNGGQIKTNNVTQWFKTRKIIEETKDSSHLTNIVEFPNSSDIIFKRGGNAFHNPGNIKFRSIIEQKYNHEGFNMITQSALTSELREVLCRESFRIVVWNDKLARYLVCKDEKTIHGKVEYLIRAYRKTVVTTEKLQSSTSAFRFQPLEGNTGTTRRCIVDCCVASSDTSSRKRLKTADGRLRSDHLSNVDISDISDSEGSVFSSCTSRMSSAATRHY